MQVSRLRRAGLVVAAVFITAATSLSPASAAPVPGLFGAQDATFDGVYRQSLVITGLRANGAAVPAAARSWLKAQQCADGGFMSFRADTSVACTPGDAATYSGEDTNSTAAAAIALAALGEKQAAARAIAFLRAAQNVDGGFPYYAKSGSDVNSSAMAMLALRANRLNPATVTRGELTVVDYLVTATLDCTADAAARGALAYTATAPLMANDMATVQALAALSNTLPWSNPKANAARLAPKKAAARAAVKAVPTLTCPGSLSDSVPRLRDIVAGYTASRLNANAAAIPSAWGAGSDLGSTAWAVIGLAGAARGATAANAAAALLRNDVAGFTAGAGGSTDAGRAGLLLLVAASRGERATSFGGMNLVSLALGTLGA